MRAKRLRGPVIFHNRRRTQCNACLDRNALNLVGRPRFVNGLKLTGGCEYCNGSGEVVEALRVGDFYNDPWIVRA